MADYIDRKAAIERFQEIKKSGVSFKDAIYLDGVIAVLENIPAADVALIVHAKWVDDKGNEIKCYEVNGVKQVGGWAFFSNCGEYLDGSSSYTVAGNNCPSCGAIMDL